MCVLSIKVPIQKKSVTIYSETKQNVSDNSSKWNNVQYNEYHRTNIMIRKKHLTYNYKFYNKLLGLNVIILGSTQSIYQCKLIRMKFKTILHVSYQFLYSCVKKKERCKEWVRWACRKVLYAMYVYEIIKKLWKSVSQNTYFRRVPFIVFICLSEIVYCILCR